MELKEFNNLLFTTDNDAKNFMSFMLNYGFKGSVNEEKAIRNLFDSFPENFKSNIDLFEPIFARFFNKYPISQDNIGYYNKYIRNNATQVIIINKNPNWSWSKDETIIEYATLPALLKSFRSAIKNRYTEEGKELGLKFIKDHYNSFENHLLVSPAAKKKAISMCVTKELFGFLIDIGFDEFKKFCVQYDINRIDVLKLMYGADTYYGIAPYLTSTTYNPRSIDDMTYFIDDVLNNKEILLTNNRFLKLEEITGNNAQYSLRYLFVNYIQHNEPEKATLLYEKFKQQLMLGLNDVAQYLNHTQKHEYIKATEINQDFLLSVSKAITERKKNYSNSLSIRLEEDKIEKFIKYYNIIRHYEALDNIIEQKDDKVTTKKLKI